MRVYTGERDDETGKCRVWLTNEEAGPAVGEVVEVLDELNELMEARRAGRATGEEYERQRAATLARKKSLLDQIRAAENRPAPTELVHRGVRSAAGFDWGDAGDGAADLAYSVLLAEIGEPPTPPVYLRFRDDVVARLPRPSFRLPADDVREWIEANRRLVEQELFEKIEPPQPAGPGEPALAVTGAAPATPEAAPNEASGSAVVRACEQAWRDIQAHHPDLPDVVVVLGSGVERGRLVKLGHWWGGRWLADGQPRGEVLLAGEALHLSAEEVFEVLLHEAAHGLNAARRIPDTSRGGRYHNRRFETTASEVLLDAKAMPPYGFAATSLTPAATERYGRTIARLGEAMRIARQIDGHVKLGAEAEGDLGAGRGEEGREGAERGRRDAVTAVCDCGRRLRMAPSVWEQGAVACGRCGMAFEDVAERRADAEAGEVVVDDSFLTRRRAALEAEASTRREGPPPETAAVLESQLARLAAALGPSSPDDSATRPLRERLERIGRLLGSPDRSPGPPPPGVAATESQREGIRELVEAASGAGDLEALAHWYAAFGTPTEAPMPPDPARAGGRTALARALLKADGTLRGPSLPLDDAEVAAGDRLVATRDVPRLGLAAGTPGGVEQVEEAGGDVCIDFATWGRLQLSVAEMTDVGITHGYVAQEAVAEHRPDVADAVGVEANRIEPGAGW